MTLIKPLKPRQTKRERLKEALHLIESGDKRAALAILTPIVQDQPNDADAWWLFANATPDQRRARMALQNVLRLEPFNERARRMLAQLQASNISLREAQLRAENASARIGYKEIECGNCGARTRSSEDLVIDRCSFCGSQNLISPQGAALTEQIVADGLIPFVLPKHQCIPLAKKWMSRSWMTPDALRRQSEVGVFTATFLPFYAISSDVGGSYRVVQSTRDRYGDLRMRTVKRGNLNVTIRHILLAATHRLGEVLPDQIADYRMERALKYRPEKLQDAQVQLPDVPPRDLAEEAHTRMMAHVHKSIPQADRALGDVHLYPKFLNDRWLILLMPAYLATYRYQGRVYKLMINGQTGKITGQLPVDWVKVGLAVAVLLAPGVILSILAEVLGLDDNPDFAFWTLLLVVAGVGATAMVVWQAITLDDV
ncbi:MAG: hypothetical protein ACLFTK_16360 [Anaerolineales bacterium]